MSGPLAITPPRHFGAVVVLCVNLCLWGLAYGMIATGYRLKA